MTILITGGSGFVGNRLLGALTEKREQIIVCTRQLSPKNVNAEYPQIQKLTWHPMHGPLVVPPELVLHNPISAVINLMGEPIAGARWTKEKKRNIRDSRVIGTRNLVTGLAQSNSVPEVLISASAVGIYGDRGEESIGESTPPADDFLAEVSQAWELEADRMAEYGSRVVKLRFGIVLGQDGGALQAMLPVFRLGLGGKLGSGKQWFPWIHRDDLARLIIWASENDNIAGVFNATAPNPVRNEEMTRELARVLKRPAFMTVPKFALRLALGEFADSLLASQRVLPQAALSAGFAFKYNDFASAIEEILE